MKNNLKKRKKVLITGGAGYVGSSLARNLLFNNFDVVVLDNLQMGGDGVLCFLGYPGYEFYRGDIRNTNDIEKAIKGVDYVVHLAAIVGEPASNKYPEDTKTINLDGTKNIFTLAKNNGVRKFVFFSTCSSYGVQETDVLANENTPLNPVSLYAKTKIEMESFIKSEVDDNIFYTILRPSTVHGPSPRMRFDLIVNHFVRDAVLKGELEIFGGSLWRPLMWVGDAARAVEKVLNAEDSIVKNEIFNMGNTESNYKKSEIAEKIKFNFLHSLNLIFAGEDVDLRSYKVDFSKIENNLGFRHSKSLEQAISEILTLVDKKIVLDSNAKKYTNH